MVSNTSRPLLPAAVSRALGSSLVYLLLIIGTFTFPNPPGPGLDPSWRMAMGYFFENGLQFGREVVWTYGPLGFVMGKTYFGLQFWSLIIGQLILAIVSATVIFQQGLRLEGTKRLVYFAFIFLFGMLYEDALHMIVLVILGYDLLRLIDQPQRTKIILITVVLAGYAQIKFTDCVLALVIVFLSLSYGLWRQRRAEVLVLSGTFLLVYLGIWISCGQHLANLPAYFANSWYISQGYQTAMAIPPPMAALWKAVVILGILTTYAILPLILSRDKPRAWANSLLLAAYVYLNWKHGFIRADGHMIGFFFCALLPLVAYPVMLDDPDLYRFGHRWVFAVTIVFSVCALESALDGTVRLSFGWMQDRIWRNVSQVVHWKETRQSYRDLLSVARAGSDMSRSREIIGNGTVDVLGSEQSVALFNKLNYHPRPVPQSFTAFTPELAQLNGDFIASDQAPDFYLTKIETIDNRPLPIDDAQILQLLPYRYEYVLSEKGFFLWKRLPGAFDAAKYAPRLLRTETVAVNEPLEIKNLDGKPLWVKVKLKPSLLGKIRGFLYQQPQVTLNIADGDGNDRNYLMPLPMGENGFILSPIINDTVDYMCYASDRAYRWVEGLTLKIPEADMKFFAPTASVELYTLPPLATTGEKYFPKNVEKLFTMFRTPPIAFESQTGFSAAKIDGKDVAIMHAPSLMTFRLPGRAKTVSGSFGFMPATYTEGGKTNGAIFIVYWSNGSERRDLFQQYLNPLEVKADRGLHSFSVDISKLNGGLLYLEVNPGPYNDIGWDWTGWTDISISR